MNDIAPHSVEAEEAVLGSILINPDVLAILAFLDAQDFFIVRHGWIYEAMGRLQKRHEAVDYLTVIEELRSIERLEEAGGPAYLTYLVNNTPTSIHAEAYGRVVERAAFRRRGLSAAGELAQLMTREELSLDETIAEAEALFAVAMARNGHGSFESYADIASRLYDRIEAVYLDPDNVDRVTTGYPELDRILGGYKAGTFNLIAGRPAMGKSSLLLNQAEAMALNVGNVAFFSLEMTKDQLMGRSAAGRARVNTHALDTGRFAETDWQRIVSAIDAVSKYSIFVDDSPYATPAILRRKVLELQRKVGNVQAVFVDYINLMTSGLKRISSENMTGEMSAISNGIMRVARETGIPFIVAAQLNREVDGRTNRRPILKDLRDSGSLEQDAYTIQFIYREQYYAAQADPERNDESGFAEVNVAKHRNGPTGTAQLWFNRELTRFEDEAERKTNWLQPARNGNGRNLYRE